MESKTYEGKPCKRCGEKERYIKGNVCIRCKKISTEAYRNTFRGKEAMGNAKRNRINKNADIGKTERRRAAEDMINGLGGWYDE